MNGNGGTRRIGRAIRRNRGQSLIEMVLVLPLLLLVLFGILEFANAWRTYQVITNSGREGCRYAVTPDGSNDADVVTRVENRLAAGGLTPADATISVTRACVVGAGQPSCVGEPVTVDVTYPFQFKMIGPIAELICSGCGSDFGSVTLLTTTVMRSEF